MFSGKRAGEIIFFSSASVFISFLGVKTGAVADAGDDTGVVWNGKRVSVDLATAEAGVTAGNNGFTAGDLVKGNGVTGAIAFADESRAVETGDLEEMGAYAFGLEGGAA